MISSPPSHVVLFLSQTKTRRSALPPSRRQHHETHTLLPISLIATTKHTNHPPRPPSQSRRPTPNHITIARPNCPRPTISDRVILVHAHTTPSRQSWRPYYTSRRRRLRRKRTSLEVPRTTFWACHKPCHGQHGRAEAGSARPPEGQAGE